MYEPSLLNINKMATKFSCYARSETLLFPCPCSCNALRQVSVAVLVAFHSLHCKQASHVNCIFLPISTLLLLSKGQVDPDFPAFHFLHYALLFSSMYSADSCEFKTGFFPKFKKSMCHLNNVGIFLSLERKNR